MGANTFTTLATGATATEAFRKAVDKARYDYGHRGYTGTIAEKMSFIIIDHCSTEKEAHKMALELIDSDDERIDDKYGPAGCIGIKESPNLWLFFGWASS